MDRAGFQLQFNCTPPKKAVPTPAQRLSLQRSSDFKDASTSGEVRQPPIVGTAFVLPATECPLFSVFLCLPITITKGSLSLTIWPTGYFPTTRPNGAERKMDRHWRPGGCVEKEGNGRLERPQEKGRRGKRAETSVPQQRVPSSFVSAPPDSTPC